MGAPQHTQPHAWDCWQNKKTNLCQLRSKDAIMNFWWIERGVIWDMVFVLHRSTMHGLFSWVSYCCKAGYSPDSNSQKEINDWSFSRASVICINNISYHFQPITIIKWDDMLTLQSQSQNYFSFFLYWSSIESLYFSQTLFLQKLRSQQVLGFWNGFKEAVKI